MFLQSADTQKNAGIKVPEYLLYMPSEIWDCIVQAAKDTIIVSHEVVHDKHTSLFLPTTMPIKSDTKSISDIHMRKKTRFLACQKWF